MKSRKATRVLVQIEMPTHPIKSPEKLSIEDRVRDALELICSGYSSPVEWIMINKLHAELKRRKRNPRIQNLIDMIEPILARFGYHGINTET